MGEEFSVEDLIIILQRRFFYFVIPAVATIILGVAGVMLLPSKYTAQGTILVESQQIPTELVRSTITAYAQERIQTIRQRVMTRNQMLEVAKKFSLFSNASGLSESERVGIMRNNLKVNMITASGRSGANRDGTIAFTVSYTDPDRNKAYLTANEFMTLFLSEDVRTRTAGASNTTEFFIREAARLRDSVADLEERISEYKSQNADALPEHLNMHLDMLERVTRDYNNSQATIAQLEEEKRFLETQLISGASAENGLDQLLARLEAELAQLRATFNDNYPAVKAKRDEIAAIKRQMAPSAEIQRLRSDLGAAEAALTALERTDEPDVELVLQAEQNVEAARLALSDKITEESRRGTSDIAGVQLEGRLAIIDNRIRMAMRQADSSQEKIQEYQQRVAATPEIERGLAALTRDHENLFREYQDVLNKQQDAQLAENLEENQQAEKFSILEPALMPDAPSSPQRGKLLAMVLFAALGVGGAIALGVEMMLQTVRGRNHLTNIVESHPIAVIPYIHGVDEKRFALPFLNRPKTAPASI